MGTLRGETDCAHTPSASPRMQGVASGESKVNGDLFPVNFYMPHGVLADQAQVRDPNTASWSAV